MLVRAVDCGRRLSKREHREIPKVRLRKVRIKCQQLTVCNGLRCAAAALEHPADKPADILDAALLCLGELLVLGHGFVRPLCLGETRDELGPHHFFIFPFFVHPGAPYSDGEAGVVPELTDGSCLCTHEDSPMLTPPML